MVLNPLSWTLTISITESVVELAENLTAVKRFGDVAAVVLSNQTSSVPSRSKDTVKSFLGDQGAALVKAEV